MSKSSSLPFYHSAMHHLKGEDDAGGDDAPKQKREGGGVKSFSVDAERTFTQSRALRPRR